jgi:hypothetical protein
MMNRGAGDAEPEVRGRRAAATIVSSAARSIAGPRPDA